MFTASCLLEYFFQFNQTMINILKILSYFKKHSLSIYILLFLFHLGNTMHNLFCPDFSYHSSWKIEALNIFYLKNYFSIYLTKNSYKILKKQPLFKKIYIKLKSERRILLLFHEVHYVEPWRVFPSIRFFETVLYLCSGA